jgi:hypothetical protein
MSIRTQKNGKVTQNLLKRIVNKLLKKAWCSGYKNGRSGSRSVPKVDEDIFHFPGCGSVDTGMRVAPSVA